MRGLGVTHVATTRPREERVLHTPHVKVHFRTYLETRRTVFPTNQHLPCVSRTSLSSLSHLPTPHPKLTRTIPAMSSASTPDASPMHVQPLHNPSQAAHVLPQAPLGNATNGTAPAGLAPGMGAKALLAKKMAKNM